MPKGIGKLMFEETFLTGFGFSEAVTVSKKKCGQYFPTQAHGRVSEKVH